MPNCLLIAGAAGFIGSHLTDALQQRGHDIIALGRSHGVTQAGAVIHPWSTIDESWLADAAASTSTVAWVAGTTTPGASAGRPDVEFMENLAPLATFLQALHRAPPARVVYVSSGGTIYGDLALGSATEATPLEPKSYYSAGKAAGEAFLTAYAHQTGAQVVILRPSNVYGTSQPFRPGFGIVPTAFRAIASNEPLIIWGDGEAVRDYLHVDDLVDLMVRVIESPFKPGTEILNASSNIATSLNALLKMVETATGRKVPREYRSARPFDVDRVVLDNSRARTRYGWAPTTSLGDGIAKAWSSSTR